MESKHENHSVRNFLKKKILQRREEQGLRSIDIDFKPKEISPMTKEEKEKERKRRQSNRESAHRSRVKEKEEYERNNKLQQQLESRKEQLLAVIRKYEEDKHSLVSQLCEKLPKELIQQTLENTNNPVTAGISTESCAKHSDRYTDAAEGPFFEDSISVELMEADMSGSSDLSDSTYFINSVCNYVGDVTTDTASSTEYCGNDMVKVDFADHNYYAGVQENSPNAKNTFRGNRNSECLNFSAITRNTEHFQDLTVNSKNIEGSDAIEFPSVPGTQFLLIYPYDANTDGDPSRDSSLLHFQVC